MTGSRRDWVIAVCTAKPGAVEDYPFGDEVAVFKVAGRMFALVPLGEAPGSVSLKCDPELAISLRARYAGVRPGTTSASGTGTPWPSTARYRTRKCGSSSITPTTWW
jgi:hypothetical protein